MSVPSISLRLILPRSVRSRADYKRLLVVVLPLLLLLAWSVVAELDVFPDQIMVAPSDVLHAFGQLIRNGDLQVALQYSLQRLGIGYLIGAAVGLAFGIAMGLSETVEGLTGPTFHALRQVPSMAFIPMFVLLFGVEETFKITIIAKATFFPISLATSDAVRGLPRSYFEVARVYCLPPAYFLRRVVLPATIPPVLTGLRLALGRAWMVLVAAELIAAESGIGQMMEMGRQMMRIDIVMVGVVITGCIGFALDCGFRALERRLVRWRTQ